MGRLYLSLALHISTFFLLSVSPHSSQPALLSLPLSQVYDNSQTQPYCSATWVPVELQLRRFVAIGKDYEAVHSESQFDTQIQLLQS